MPRKAPEFPCSTCNKNVNKNHRAVLCDSCERWIHIKCNLLSLTDYNNLKKDPLPFICINCLKGNMPFTTLTDNEFIPLAKGIMLPQDNTSFAPISPSMHSHIQKLNQYLNKNYTTPDDDVDDDSAGNCRIRKKFVRRYSIFKK